MKPDMAVKEVLIGKYCHVQVSSVHSHVIHSLPAADAVVVVSVVVIVVVFVCIVIVIVIVVVVGLVVVVFVCIVVVVVVVMSFISYFGSCCLYYICLWSTR